MAFLQARGAVSMQLQLWPAEEKTQQKQQKQQK